HESGQRAGGGPLFVPLFALFVPLFVPLFALFVSLFELFVSSLFVSLFVSSLLTSLLVPSPGWPGSTARSSNATQAARRPSAETRASRRVVGSIIATS